MLFCLEILSFKHFLYLNFFTEVVRDRENVRENRENRENREVMMRNERLIGAGSADMVLDNTPPITPDSSDGNDSPSR